MSVFYFKAEDLTRWEEAVNGIYKQQFELDLNGNEGSHQYLLTIEHRPEKNQVRIGSEKFLFDWSRSGDGVE